MQTQIHEVAPDIFRLSTFIPEVAAPAGFTFNQFLVRDEQPFLYHTGMRGLFPLVSDAIAKLIDLDTLRWISFSHVEADECGAMNALLAAAPQAEVIHGELACALSLNDLADRPPRAVADGEVLDLGTHRLTFLATPHVPHNWESGLWHDESTGTMFVGDLFGQTGDTPPVIGDGAGLVAAAVGAEEVFHSISGGPALDVTLHRLAQRHPATLAVMHGASFHGDTSHLFGALADGLRELGAAA